MTRIALVRIVSKTKKIDVDEALLIVIRAFLEGESKMLEDTAELNDPHTMEMHSLGLELWRLVRFNFVRASAVNVIIILESVRNMQAANNLQNVMFKDSCFGETAPRIYRQAVGSKEQEFVKMRTHGISV